MINPLFQNKFPFSANYFSELLSLVFENKREFPQALIFEGADTKMQYLFSLELARILNCIGDKSSNCDCINCKWIKTHSHPAINNVSEIHFKGEGDESKTVISAKQAREIEKALMLSSDYHRFFIFFSSGEKEYDPFELMDFQNLNYSTDINYSFNPLNYGTFHQTTPNALLKSIEEPPKRTTFIFLTKSREEILPTIVSRCQVFKLSGLREKIDYSNIATMFSLYPNFGYKDAFDISQNFQNYIKENNEILENVLNKMLVYLMELLKQNLSMNDKIKRDIAIINDAIKHKKANMNDKIILDTMFLRMARGY
ncbi:MAG: hypothetical protein IJB79_04805 [Candidatus Gastranaerophilales bacterium]|nr:hypothetical protein [Candidatus Gastranaerophilales bacterium]